MELLLQIHKSILDPQFYRDVVTWKARRVILFCVSLLFFSASIIGIARTYYLVEPNNGLAPAMARTLQGMSIIDGSLKLSDARPQEISPALVLVLFKRVLDVPANHPLLTSVTIKLDTSLVVPDSSDGVHLLLRSREALLQFTRGMVFVMPYKDLLLGAKELSFTESGVREFLKQKIVIIALYCVFLDMVRLFFMLLISILILSVAAFILRFKWRRPFSYYCTIACFAVSPIAVGSIIIALAGVKFSGLGDVLVIVAAICMFRAVAAITASEKSTKEE